MAIRILSGIIRHRRESPRHAFSYSANMLALELNQLEEQIKSSFISHNAGGILSLYDKDYLDSRSLPIIQKLRVLLDRYYPDQDSKKVTLLTTPRCFGYTFNPVSFYLVFNSEGDPGVIVCEVNNTFGAKYIYHCRLTKTGDRSCYQSQPFSKHFFVSPFYEVTGKYSISLVINDELIELGIGLVEEREIFRAELSGRFKEFSSLRDSFSLSLMAWSAMLRIHWQALKLILVKRTKTYLPPTSKDATSPHLSKSNPLVRMRLTILRILNSKVSRENAT
ncbi:MAG: DUF1365 domain-containing protein [Bdellovibrionales bacterium]|nr:DUF1365 domain-containing protein [Bdellovibrionales bacterium]